MAERRIMPWTAGIAKTEGDQGQADRIYSVISYANFTDRKLNAGRQLRSLSEKTDVD
jgi:hypothetical protein